MFVRILLPSILIVLGLVFFMGDSSAQSSSSSPGQWPDITFQHKTPLKLAVTRIDVVEDYVPPLREPNVEHEMPVSPALATQSWARDRLRLMGGLHRAVVRIKDASVIEVPLETTSGWRGLFTNDQEEQYQATLTVRLEIIDAESGTVVSWIEATSQHSQTVPESASIIDRETAYFALTEATINSLDAELENQIRSHFTPYLIP